MRYQDLPQASAETDIAAPPDAVWRWVSDIARFQKDYPDFRLKYDSRGIIEELYENGHSRWREAG